MSLSASTARERLQKVLGDSVHCVLDLRDVLLQERGALEQRDTALLGKSADLKESCIRKLAAFEDARGEISRDAGFSASLDDMSALTEWCDKDAVIRNCWSQFTEIARECDALNSTNGAIIRVRRQQILAGLALLRGGEVPVESYGIKGSETTGFGGRELAEA
ncbi:MAG: flagellar protein FlgN [Gammaproteobacteria bacterium]|nr:flagellar protein FlgN [Gammaproteobacteria bacterium]MDH4313235.1 flagellar protein FlgN [Gammaproteobacteria bacterium]MDH5213559.1 flagellar protein FlgN [Gammaproteobacteria bacterium]